MRFGGYNGMGSFAFAASPEFDDFLFASIGEKPSGMLLSAVSALARLDVDPVAEKAAKSAGLPALAFAAPS